MKIIKIDTDLETLYINPCHIMYLHKSTFDDSDTIIELSNGQSIFTQLSIEKIIDLMEIDRFPQ